MTMRCCIVGGGPAGIVLGYLLARAGVEVCVLEKHADFFRDFRGDTIHPSTLQIMDELGLLDRLLQIPHSQLQLLTGRFGATRVAISDFSHVPGRCKFIAFMPQWDFLNFLSTQAKRYPSFELQMETEGTDLQTEGNRVTGVIAKTRQGLRTIAADLVVACDGRHSVLREKAGLKIQKLAAPIDALWMRISRKPSDPGNTFGTVVPGAVFVTIDRNEYYQCALVIRKGGFEEIKSRGLQAFRDQVAALAPYLKERTNELREWDDIKLLTVAVDRLERWHRPGLLCIGDAAHAMSPIGGVGINLAIQDAVAAANILSGSLRTGTASTKELAAVQRRREFPTKVTQAVQIFVQNHFMERVLSVDDPIAPPLLVRILNRVPLLRRIPAAIVGVGVRPEHVRTKEAQL